MLEIKRRKQLFKKDNIPLFFLFTSVFFPILPEAITSTAIICFITSSILLFGKQFIPNIKLYGFLPLLANIGFYVMLGISCLYSKNILSAFGGMQASISLLIVPIVIIYVHPRIEKPFFDFLTIGYILGLLYLFLYLYHTILNGLTIDRFPNLLRASFFEKISAIGQYPYEFAISKAHKHLKVIYDTHKVYLSINFAIGLFFSIRLLFMFKSLIVKGLFLISGFAFFIAIVYLQSIATLIAVGISLPAIILISVKSTKKKIIVTGILASLLVCGIHSGLFKTYQNKNTEGIVKFLLAYFYKGSEEQGRDKRYYIYDCAIDLAKKEPLFGVGLGDVQPYLNSCYESKNYVVAEYLSKGSEINTHNFYLHMMGASGILGVSFFVLLVLKTFEIAFKGKDYVYTVFLFVFFSGLFFENLFVRTMGVFPFALFNSLLFAKNMISEDES